MCHLYNHVCGLWKFSCCSSCWEALGICCGLALVNIGKVFVTGQVKKITKIKAPPPPPPPRKVFVIGQVKKSTKIKAPLFMPSGKMVGEPFKSAILFWNPGSETHWPFLNCHLRVICRSHCNISCWPDNCDHQATHTQGVCRPRADWCEFLYFYISWLCYSKYRNFARAPIPMQTNTLGISRCTDRYIQHMQTSAPSNSQWSVAFEIVSARVKWFIY